MGALPKYTDKSPITGNQIADGGSISRGPEIELCLAEPGSNPAIENDWSLLPFMALSDGAHTYGFLSDDTNVLELD